MASGFSWRAAIPSSDVRMDIVLLLHRFDGQRERARRHADGNLVALLLAHEGPSDRGFNRDAAGGWVAFDRPDQVVRLGRSFRVHHVDGRARAGDARVRLLDDLRPADHLLQLVDAAVEEADLLLRLLVLGVVFDVTRLERLLEALARFCTALQRDLEIALELLQPLGRQQNRFVQVHLPSLGPTIIPAIWIRPTCARGWPRSSPRMSRSTPRLSTPRASCSRGPLTT